MLRRYHKIHTGGRASAETDGCTLHSQGTVLLVLMSSSCLRFHANSLAQRAPNEATWFPLRYRTRARARGPRRGPERGILWLDRLRGLVQGLLVWGSDGELLPIALAQVSLVVD